ncbi:hypothetical protein [Cryobacterium tepidiphilum]|uniref:Uncharacterized protein n=1 Tax=Cryobacterium tepidiphilum TaxID=2486026 RepID=A0A3M8L330_9MICO|nr:hypothetical protein [Cryobacterium tepidiphilum]RNE59132.1 hypothetical protein EEJ31_10905 [Cryobacterium tepidiphilum]
MQWWNSFVQWFTDADSLPVLFGAVVLVVASVLATWASRSAIKSLVRQRDREQQAAVIATLVDAAIEMSSWNSLSPQEQLLVDRAAGQADIQLRLLPVRGSALAAEWASHQLAEIRLTSGAFGYQSDAVLHEFRDRLLDWQAKPGKTRKVFQSDLERWQSQGTTRPSPAALLGEQEDWTPRQARDDRAPETNLLSPARSRSAAPAPLGNEEAPHEATQRLIDDVEALEVRPTGAGSHSAPVLPA